MDAALFIAPEGDAGKGYFYGRYAANRGLLHGLARHGSGDALHCITPTQDHALELRRDLDTAGLAARKLVRLVRPTQDLPRLGIGTFLRLDPNLSEAAWLRRADGGDASFSVCGLTHSLSEHTVVRWLQDLAVAPLFPWDALVCTSRAAQALCRAVIDDWQRHLAERLGVVVVGNTPLALPVIPLGIDCDAFRPPADAPARRASWRARLDIGEDEIAVLFFGRLSHFEKAHPAPMYLAMEEASRRTKRRLHLIQAGRFPRAEIGEQYRAAAARLCPSVVCHFLDGGDADVGAEIRLAADIFVSLSDNVQETFGLTPVEAMAAGLPAVVSNWDGYRDTVADGETGLCIPTASVPPGSGGDIAAQYVRTGNYPEFAGRLSQCTAVSVPLAAAAIAHLADHSELRRQFGAAGQARARALFDWSSVVPQYEALWAELAERRCRANPKPPRHAYPDPFAAFAAFPSFHAGDDCQVGLPPDWWRRLAVALAEPLCRFAAPELADEAPAALERFGGGTAADFVAAFSDRPEAARQLLLWLAKMDVVALARR